MPDKKQLIYGIIGRPLTHSFSPTYFNQKFESENINAKYLKFELPDIGDLMEVLAEYPTLSGLNVTIPYKQQVIPYMDEMDENAKKIGAVNVIKIIRGKGHNLKFKGFNSDCPAFADTLRPLLKPEYKKALILGTGGASKAIYQGLVNLGLEPTFVSRTARDGVITYADLTPEVMAEHNIIVNCTPVGMYPDVDKCPPIPYNLLTRDHLCYDLIYNPDSTTFMKKAREQGAEVKNGLEMLLLQAFISWQIWNS